VRGMGPPSAKGRQGLGDKGKERSPKEEAREEEKEAERAPAKEPEKAVVERRVARPLQGNGQWVSPIALDPAQEARYQAFLRARSKADPECSRVSRSSWVRNMERTGRDGQPPVSGAPDTATAPGRVPPPPPQPRREAAPAAPAETAEETEEVAVEAEEVPEEEESAAETTFAPRTAPQRPHRPSGAKEEEEGSETSGAVTPPEATEPNAAVHTDGETPWTRRRRPRLGAPHWRRRRSRHRRRPSLRPRSGGGSPPRTSPWSLQRLPPAARCPPHPRLQPSTGEAAALGQGPQGGHRAAACKHWGGTPRPRSRKLRDGPLALQGRRRGRPPRSSLIRACQGSRGAVPCHPKTPSTSIWR